MKTRYLLIVIMVVSSFGRCKSTCVYFKKHVLAGRAKGKDNLKRLHNEEGSRRSRCEVLSLAEDLSRESRSGGRISTSPPEAPVKDLVVTPKDSPPEKREKASQDEQRLNTRSISLFDANYKQVGHYPNAVLEVEHHFDVVEDTLERTILVIRYGDETKTFVKIPTTKILHDDSRLFLMLDCTEEDQQNLRMEILFEDFKQYKDALKKLNGNNDLNTWLSFNENVAVSEDSRVLISQAIRISERCINTKIAKVIFIDFFCVPLELFRVNLADIRIEFKCEEEAPLTKEEKEYNTLPPLSWIIRSEPREIFVNDMLKNRWENGDEAEKRTIVFALSILILHELANCAIQWTHNQRFTRKNGVVRTPGRFNKDAGRFLEVQLFDFKVVTVVKYGKISAVAIDRCHHIKHSTCGCDNIRFEKISSQFVESVGDPSNTDTDILDLSSALVGEAGLGEGEITRSSLIYDDPDDVDEEFIGKPLSPGETVRENCGTHNLDDDDEDDEEKSD